MIIRRSTLSMALIVGLLIQFSLAVRAQNYPTGPITFVVPFPPGGSKAHGRPGHRHSRDNALHRNTAGALRNGNSIRDSIKSVNENDNVCGFRRGARTPCPHGNADACGRQSRCIVDAVTDHQGWVQALLGRHCIDLIGRFSVRKHSIKIECGPNGFCGIGSVTGQHHDPRHSGCPKSLNGTRCLTP